MNIINNMPVGRKLACGFGIVLLLMVILGVVAYSEVNKMALYADIQGGADNLQESMITARQQEKNYILKNDRDSFTLHDEAMDGVVADLTHLKAMVTNAGERAAIVEIEAMIPKYTAPFGKLMVKIEEKSVALGATVASANDVEGAIKASSTDQAAKTTMLLDLNLIRRNEKNFQTRGDLNANADVSRNDEYTAAMSNEIGGLKAYVSTLAIPQSEKSAINGELDSYLANFLRYHDLAADTDVITADDGDMVQYGQELVEATDVLTTIANDKSHETAASAKTAIIIFLLVAIVAGAGIALFLTRVITRPLNEVMIAANKIKDGDFGYDIRVDSNDELGKLARTFGEMKAGLQGIVTETIRVAKEAQKGNLDARSSVQAKGELNDLVVSMNAMLEAVVIPIRENIRIVNAYADGKLDTRVQIKTAGEFTQLAETLDQFGEDLPIIAETGRIAGSAAEGDLTVKAEIDAEGDYRKLVSSVDELVGVLSDTVVTAKGVSTNVLGIAEGLASAAEESASAAEESSSSVEEQTSAIQELTSEAQGLSDVAHELMEGLNKFTVLEDEHGHD
ncbi:MAG: HAMP domain-containing protein [Methanosarcinales archaeon]|nr:MAG: HAMP domain-containing protein [Methanosarcinales archaeon]